MSWIKLISEDEATGLLKQLYDKRPRYGGKVASIVKAHSLFPEALDTSMKLYEATMYVKGETDRRLRELIATYVSFINKCHY
ncbi:MAG: carboxymuconolactone decarboxylase family protein [Planctomycetes bacterium]|nr:carboxymuconolactone decarboxylase family protein [Planctomycetota bacterium]